MRILVTGGAGFIGSHLVESLVENGHQVTVVDNFLTGRPENVAHLVRTGRCRLVEHDVTRPFDSPDGPPDIVFHLASPASPEDYSRYPVETMLVNSLGTYNLLELARAAGARFILASTSEVYGDPEIHPQPETYWGHVNPVGPRAAYDEGKRFAEALTVTYHRKYGLDVRIVRIFNTYGPRNRVDDGRVVPNFIRQALRNEPLTVYGDGAQTRSFCYVSDLVKGLLKVGFGHGLAGEVFNLGNDDERPVIEVARLVKTLTGTPAPIVFLPPRPEEIGRRRPDLTKARKVLGWSPAVGLEEGLRRTIAWYREEITAGRLTT
jgi:nucleoside-diphosphate-sugar epimerase